MTAADRVLQLTAHELTKLDEIQRACPALDAQLISCGNSYLILGYPPDRETELISVRNDSLPQGIRQYRAAYEKLVAAGVLKNGLNQDNVYPPSLTTPPACKATTGGSF